MVLTFPVPDGAHDELAAQLGPGHTVRDIRTPGPAPDVVLCPSTSPQAIHRLRAEFPGAEVIIVEVQEWFGGPVTRAMDAGASGYLIAASPAALGDLLRGEPPPASHDRHEGIASDTAERAALPAADEGSAIPAMPGERSTTEVPRDR